MLVQQTKGTDTMIEEHEKQVFELVWKMFEENRASFHVSDVFTDMDGYGFSLTSADGRFTIFLHNDGTFCVADWDWENGKIDY
jgi:hypothetical protein